MMCEKCKRREATVFLTQIIGDKSTKTDLCVECAREAGLDEEMTSGWAISTVDPRDQLKAALGVNLRYPIEAYEFVCEAMIYWRGRLPDIPGLVITRHVSGRELLLIVRHVARQKFGKEAKAVLNGWKIYRTEDFGEIVFEMVEAGVLTKTPEDSREDFQNGYDFDEAFPEV
jgi:uncharacterized repeat protein (TIGR04138 family)